VALVRRRSGGGAVFQDAGCRWVRRWGWGSNHPDSQTVSEQFAIENGGIDIYS
jgi:lipoate-protein ligase A